MTINTNEWLEVQIEETRKRYEDAQADTQALQYAAEAETYNRIKNGTIPFRNLDRALEAYKSCLGDPDWGMSAARIRAIERYRDYVNRGGR